MEGFGEKSFNNIVNAAKEAFAYYGRQILYAPGIANIGAANVKVIARAQEGDWRMHESSFCFWSAFVEIQGIGDNGGRLYVIFQVRR